MVVTPEENVLDAVRRQCGSERRFLITFGDEPVHESCTIEEIGIDDGGWLNVQDPPAPQELVVPYSQDKRYNRCLFFDIVAKSTVDVTDLGKGWTQEAEYKGGSVYVRHGGHEGFERDACGWQLVATGEAALQ